MESYYEINVALRGTHLFATANRSIHTDSKLKQVLQIFNEKFPRSEGYEISITYWDCVGHIIPLITQ